MTTQGARCLSLPKPTSGAPRPWEKDPFGEILILADGTRVAYARGGWYGLVPGRVRLDFDKPVDAERIPPDIRRPFEEHCPPSAHRVSATRAARDHRPGLATRPRVV